MEAKGQSDHLEVRMPASGGPVILKKQDSKKSNTTTNCRFHYFSLALVFPGLFVSFRHIFPAEAVLFQGMIVVGGAFWQGGSQA